MSATNSSRTTAPGWRGIAWSRVPLEPYRRLRAAVRAREHCKRKSIWIFYLLLE